MWQIEHSLLTSIFIPHGHCYLWKPTLVSLHLGSDLLTSAAYLFVAFSVLLTQKRWHELSKKTVVLLSGTFWVFLGCGIVHFLNVITLWYPIYWISGAIKLFSGLWSTYVFIFVLVPLIPVALDAPTPAQLEAAKNKLEVANQEIIFLNKKLKSDNLRLSAELDILRQMQQLILPKYSELEHIEDLEIAGFMESANEVGGDYYDILYADGVVTIGIGDVTGHGLESCILMVMAQTAIRTLKERQETDPVRFLDTLNRTIYKNVQRMNSDKNLTIAILNYAEGRISISGQHEETLVVRKGGKIERIDTIDLGFPIGLDEDITDLIGQVLVELEPGDGVVLYTDGIPEARDIDRKFYGLERLCEVVAINWHLSVEQIQQATIDDLRGFIGEQQVFDDITLVVLKRRDEDYDRALTSSGS
jgi:serine phosphatase RsbU (regulator of sigma subunit)